MKVKSKNMILFICVFMFLINIFNTVKAKDLEPFSAVTKIDNGYYTFFSGVGNNQVIDIESASKNNEAKVQIYKSNQTNAQIFIMVQSSDGSYEIINKNSGKALDIKSGNVYNGATIWQYERNNTDAQKWFLKDAGNRILLYCFKIKYKILS